MGAEKNNKPCSCGSGKKYKKCHGAPRATSTGRTDIAPTITITAKGNLTEFGRQIFAERAFQQLAQRIDDNLREEGVPIPDRPDAALRTAERITGRPVPADVPDRDPNPGSYIGEDLALRIRRWYQQHYGGALDPAVRISSETEFLEHMERIDTDLTGRDTPIPGRPLGAILEFAGLLKEELRPYSFKRDPVPGRYTGDDLVIHVERWFEERYGNRILMDNGDGRSVVLLRGDPWLMELPWILGGGGGPNFICEYGRSTTLPSQPEAYRIGDPPPPPTDYNVLDSIAGLPDGLAKSLTEEECSTILDTFLVARAAFTRLGRSSREGLLPLIRGDLDAAVDHLSRVHRIAGNNHQTGLSQWASLQAAEKALKAYIQATQSTFKFSHNLAGLAKDAVALGLPHVDSQWLSAIQCSAGVRYGEVPVSLEQAVTAHHASLRVVAHVMAAMPNAPAK